MSNGPFFRGRTPRQLNPRFLPLSPLSLPAWYLSCLFLFLLPSFSFFFFLILFSKLFTAKKKRDVVMFLCVSLCLCYERTFFFSSSRFYVEE